jgi:hypothetical protein
MDGRCINARSIDKKAIKVTGGWRVVARSHHMASCPAVVRRPPPIAKCSPLTPYPGEHVKVLTRT